MKIKILIVFLVCISSLSARAAAKSGEALELTASAWGAFMRGDVVVNGQKVAVQRETWDYYSDLAVGGSLELALRNSSMVLMGYFDYFDNISSDVSAGSQKGTLETSEMVGCIAVGYPLAPIGGPTTFDLLVGLQGLRMENELKINGTKQTSSTDVYDPVFMLRFKTQLGNKLYVSLPVTFGLSYLGDSELVYDVGLQLLYQLTDTFDVRGGYRISGFDYQEDNSNKWDYYVQGYTLGVGMTF